MTDIEHEQIQANIGKLMAETMKLNAEAAKLQKESRWFPVIWATAFVAAVLALAKFMH
jgi:cell division protein FtsB